MEWVIGIVTGIVAGVVSSIIFFCVMRCVKPKVVISDNICHDTVNSHDIYKIKVVNLTKAMLVNLRYTLMYHVDNGKGVSSVVEISPIKCALTYIDAYKKEKNYSDYALRITYLYDKAKYPLTSNTKLVFTIFAEHPYSNRTICCKKTYFASNVEQGQFETGVSTKII